MHKFMSTKTFDTNLPSIPIDGSLSSYLTQIKKFPILSAEEEALDQGFAAGPSASDGHWRVCMGRKFKVGR